jgi:hypothetical protein
MPSPQNSMEDLDKPSAGEHHHKHSTKRCDEPLNQQPFGATVGRGIGVATSPPAGTAISP